ncbi:MAG TPA: glycosyltransferase family 2 protein [Candidatus Paceibacterota bacterium]
MNRNKVAAVIPAFNEAETIREVINAVKQSELIDEVIVVSDGSNDETAAIARSCGITVYDLETNVGKGWAMLYAVKRTDADIIIFLDADLIGLESSHVDKILRPVLNEEKEMVVGIRDLGKIYAMLYRFLPLTSGQRAIRKHILTKIHPQFIKGFTVEFSMNYYCRLNNLSVGVIFLSGVTIRKKIHKVDFFRALCQYISMIFEILKCAVLIRLSKNFLTD